MTASARTGETFNYAAWFGQYAITGFLASGTLNDVIQLDPTVGPERVGPLWRSSCSPSRVTPVKAYDEYYATPTLDESAT
jgi:hypothetical protein